MVTREDVKGRWNEVKGRLMERWGQLTDSDLQQFRGSTNELIGAVQQKTGATRREVERFLGQVIGESSEMSGRVSDAAQLYADDAAKFAKENYDKYADATRQFSRNVTRNVKRHPGEAVAIAFGVGLFAGALFFMQRRR